MKKVLFFALVACAILAGCKNENKNTDPQTPQGGEETVKAEAYVNFYVPPFVYKYCDFKVYYVKSPGDTVQVAYSQRSTPLDTVSEDHVFYDTYKRSNHLKNVPLNEIRVYKSTQTVEATTSERTVYVKMVRNSTPLDTTVDKTENIYCAVIDLEDKDKGQDKKYSISSLYFLKEVYDVDLKKSESGTPDQLYQKTIDAYNLLSYLTYFVLE